jgi:hypothetical protein
VAGGAASRPPVKGYAPLQSHDSKLRLLPEIKKKGISPLSVQKHNRAGNKPWQISVDKA